MKRNERLCCIFGHTMTHPNIIYLATFIIHLHMRILYVCVYVYVYVYVYMSICIYVYMYISICIWIWICICIYMCVCVCVCVVQLQQVVLELHYKKSIIKCHCKTPWSDFNKKILGFCKTSCAISTPCEWGLWSPRSGNTRRSRCTTSYASRPPFLVETHGDLGIPHLGKPPYVYIYIYDLVKPMVLGVPNFRKPCMYYIYM